MFKFLNKFLDLNQKEINRLQLRVNEINTLTDKFSRLKNAEDFAAYTADLKHRLAEGENLDDLLPPAFALVREASERAIGLRPFDVQLMAATAFHEGKVAEQKTGEGKTLSAVPALYLNSLSGKGAHLVTVNDYLARRDAGWNGPTFHLLGLSVGVIMHEKSLLYDPEFFDPAHGDDRLAHLRPVTRQEAYAADITYGTNNEFGFDYLRDNMVGNLKDMSQRGHHFAIVDEVDSILIDEARTPLIISAPDTEPTQKYYEFAKLVDRLSGDTDYVIDEKHRTANLTEHGIKKVEKLLGVDNLYEKDFDTIHHLENALKSRTLFIRDKDYIIRDNQVIIVDEFTGRLMPGRRWSEGIHQAVEAKENVTIQQESRTLATISFQNYFRMYTKLAGMTGTAATEAEEFQKIYKLDVVIVPTHKPMVRIDNADIVYKNTPAKYTALAEEIAGCHQRGQPILVGTTSIEKNEVLSGLLKHKGVPHALLNAKNHEQEATIISEAGRKGAVTIATNIAGRGVDIVLGGTPPPNPKFVLGEDKLTDKQYAKQLAQWQAAHDEVVSSGGLHVIGTERHESRRIDNQLRGRSGRQGDPGSTRFYLALDDDIMRIFGGDQVAKIMGFLKIPESEPIEHGMVSKAIEQAQVKVEGFNFDARKHVVEYDDVMNKQREIIYGLRHRVLAGEIPDEEIINKLSDQVTNVVNMYAPKGIIESEVLPITTALVEIVPFDDVSQKSLTDQIKKLGTAEEIIKLTRQIITDAATQRKAQVGDPVWGEIIKYAYLSSIDNLWMDHLDAVDDLRSGIGLRGYGQRDPLVEYKGEAFSMFERLVTQIESEFSKRLFRIQVGAPPPVQPPPQMVEIKPDASAVALAQAEAVNPEAITNNQPPPGDFMSAFSALQKGGVDNPRKNLGRNDPCWCGSGKKYKKCHYPN
ncbi:preprotein translocase subunit SecA [Candidatus Amesbacteria bacterium RIFCSPHIGHO2_02_FULL_48_21]|uniref:Protein translocase subunit SecA n=2 Tax=Candidatus Amesiibacteriota TaxID=1752730 RepID=A0A1F4Z477_9BACT|nr:MAG: Protein translocase subunit SecA [Candidatus Amesbacteria bacterium GW2011_GWC1_48_10]OGC89828.1 MAG: preprotein translocase subunit SecA [Candidatus Amesbacteria bacterium RBG_19FT_COMBO_48_16]OGC95908.1 MAG: preprotein translocase subunit SecA [Candidatus Amesbacteria bacterium RIFCSPHIGHO2_02_FULL_48_21]OGD00971.1 MAG: preprotein translocase subunit SecA [Candidatus Amesbacteria bacterium RIFCSPHIGHO2_12_FULL_48_14]OGD01439.1 MAG: preprotein translocase subunit SecA [Candidatus Amesb